MEKKIDKLLKKAELINDKDIDDYENTNFIDLPLEDFMAVSGDLFFHKEKDAFYKNKGDIWYRFKHRRETLYEPASLIDPAIIVRIEKLEAWAKDFKRYVDESFNYFNTKVVEIERLQSEAIKELQQYTDLKIKEQEKKCKGSSTKSKKSTRKKQQSE